MLGRSARERQDISGVGAMDVLQDVHGEIDFADAGKIGTA
jgi:hypothetical protein